jgi:6-pyruvoyltetrahydropterin/6-carboxytetrahydropterin synthase
MPQVRLNLYKEYFKFSSAHFLIFDAQNAERLHGHNYGVQVELVLPASLPPSGYGAEFGEVKRKISARLEEWDEHVLLPARQPEMKFQEENRHLHVHFRDRYYVFPRNEVILLETHNCSVEELSRLLALDLKTILKPYGIAGFSTTVEESAGQSATYTMDAADLV